MAAKIAPSGVDPRIMAKGKALRRRVTGGAYADNADNGLDPALRVSRELITEYVWGKVWTRKGIPPRIRSFMNIGLLMALNRPHEFKLQLHMALRNGLTRAEIGEAMAHASAYCGVPAGVASIAIAREAFAEDDVRRAQTANKPVAKRTGRRPKR